MTLPRMLYRIEFDEGFGWPDCTRRERTARNYSTAEGAREMVETIRRLPSHHRLIGVWQTSTDWTQVPEEMIL